MSDCSKHKKEVAGITDMKELAEMIGGLHYESLQNLLGYLSNNLYMDGLKDRGRKREKLGYALSDASDDLHKAAIHIQEAWQISKPFMTKNKTNQ